MTGLPLTSKARVYKHKLLEDLPDGFIVVVDTRETDPLLFRGNKPRKGIPLVRKTLSYGDYSILGFEECISVERKKVGDLFTCLGSQRERFKRELEKLSGFERKWLLIEDLEGEVLQPQEHGSMHPNAVRQSLVSIEIKLGIPIHYTPNKTWSEIWVLDRLVKYYRWKRGGE